MGREDVADALCQLNCCLKHMSSHLFNISSVSGVVQVDMLALVVQPLQEDAGFGNRREAGNVSILSHGQAGCPRGELNKSVPREHNYTKQSQLEDDPVAATAQTWHVLCGAHLALMASFSNETRQLAVVEMRSSCPSLPYPSLPDWMRCRGSCCGAAIPPWAGPAVARKPG